MIQNSLFSNADIQNSVKERNKKILGKTAPKKTSGGSPIRVTSTNELRQKLQVIQQVAKERLKSEEGKYLLLTTEEDVKNYVDKAIEYGYAGLDTETTGLDTIVDRLVGTCLYVPGQKAAYIPHWHTDLENNPVENQISYEFMSAQFARMDKVKFILHNAKFDIKVLFTWLGRWIKPYWDTQIAAAFLNENEPRGLKYLHDKYIMKGNKEKGELNTYTALFDGLPFNFIPYNIGYMYAAGDPIKTFELYEFQRPFLDENDPRCKAQTLEKASRVFKDIEMELIPYLAEIEHNGIYIDKEQAEKLSAEYTQDLKEALKTVNETVLGLNLRTLPSHLQEKLGGRITVGNENIDVPLNIGSPQQMQIILYDLLGLKSTDKSKPKGTGEEILLGMAQQTEDEQIRKFLKAVLAYRKAVKMLGTYVDKLPRIVKEKTGRVHTSFNQYGAVTGRMSSDDPNVQNIPSRGKYKKIRTMFSAGAGRVLFGADFSQQEPRILAHICAQLFNDTSLVDAYNSGLDLYTWIASEVYGVPYDQCQEFDSNGKKNPPECKERRDSVKAVVLGIMYGRGTASVADQLGWSVSKAQETIDMFFDRFKSIKDVINYYQTMARQKGYVTTVYGRKRRLPEINLPKFELFYESVDENGKKVRTPVDDKSVTDYYLSKLNNAKYNNDRNKIKKQLKDQGIFVMDNGAKIADAERQCLNSVIQGSAADVTKKAMVDIGRCDRLRELGAYMVLTVHDEVISSIPEENAVEASQLMSDIMVKSCEDVISVRMKCDAEIMRHWSGDDITDELKEKYAV